MKKSRKVLREQMLQRYNHEFAPRKPSGNRIDKIKRYIKSVKKERQKLVEDQLPLLEEQLEQEAFIRDYSNQPGLAVAEGASKTYDVHKQR